MKGSETPLLAFLEGAKKRFVIPVYQRNYDWKRDNCKQLFDDLVNLITKKKSSHFFGCIVSYAPTKNEIVLIDGQQRITTVSLIMIAMVNAIKSCAVNTDDSTLINQIEDYLIDKYSKEERKIRLKPFRQDCEAFDRLIYKKEEDYIAESKVTINYRYFYDRIVNERNITVDELFEAIEDLMIIDIELEPQRGDDPQLIFESLNSTGLDLTESDKIRNFILMGLDTDVQERYYDEYWNKIEKLCGNDLDGFVRNYLTIKIGLIPNIRNIYAVFKDYIRTNGIENIEEVLSDMLAYAKVYESIISFTLGSDKANEIARRLFVMEFSVVHPFLMAYLVYANSCGLPVSETEIVLETIETLIFRRLSCDLPANALNKIFATLHNSVLKHKGINDSYSSVMIYLLENRRITTILPRDEEFIKGFTTKNIYAMRGKYKEYIFDRLENGYSKEVNDVIKNMEDSRLTIEHIMPQKLTNAWREELGDRADAIHETWLHTIANLTLTGYNSNYSNRTFQEKKTMANGFEESGLRLNQYIAKFDNWTETELKLRKEELAKKAIEIWKYPVTDFIPKAVEDELVELSEDNSVFTNRDISYFIFRDEKYGVKNWTDMMWKMANILFGICPDILYSEATNDKNVWFYNYEYNSHYKKLAEGLYYCPGSSSTWNKMAILKKLFRLALIDEDDLTLCLKTQGGEDE